MDDELISSKCDTVFAWLKVEIMLCHLGNVSTVIVYCHVTISGWYVHFFNSYFLLYHHLPRSLSLC